MDSLTTQRDLMIKYKKETYLNVGILSKIHSLPADVSKQILEEESIVKPTQNVFNHLSYYLISIVDKQKAKELSWPLFDTKMERAYRNNISSLISEYSCKGLLSPVMSSYLVNPGCFKVVVLVFQLSQLAVQRVLESKVKKPEKSQLYTDMTVKYKTGNETFVEDAERETIAISCKFSNYIQKRKIMEELAMKLRNGIVQVNKRLILSNAQNFINNLVDGFLQTHDMNEETKNEILKLKNVKEQSNILESWLIEVDRSVQEMENEWINYTKDLLETSRSTIKSTEVLISRHIGEADKSTYMLEYNHKNDEICTKELQNHVNAEQVYVLRNIVKNERLNFPDLIRSFVISISYILKGSEVGDQIYKFNEYFEAGANNIKDVVTNMKMLVERVRNADDLLQPASPLIGDSLLHPELTMIPPLPDLYDLKTYNFQNRVMFETLTPLSNNKYRFNFSRKRNSHLLLKPRLKPVPITPFYRSIHVKDDFSRSLISCQISTYDRPKSVHNDSILPKMNETIAECQSGFTKDQILRLLSTKKSTAKKGRNKIERNVDSVKKVNLFNESAVLNESNGLFRSYSSPNLFENIDRTAFHRRGRKLSIMEEDNPSSLEVSGIARLSKDSGCATPTGVVDSPRMLFDATSLPVIIVAPTVDEKIKHILNEIESPQLKELKEEKKSPPVRMETPKTGQPIKKTSSIEKIISRFKKVRASVIPMKNNEEDFAIEEEIDKTKSNSRTVAFNANRILLPDLLSPSCNLRSAEQSECYNLNNFNKKDLRTKRESLGSALGVDDTFLDQYDLID